jgi:hypothetical protein
VILEDKALRVEFDPSTGAIVSLLNKNTGWNLNRRPELGLSFSMIVPMPDRRYNPVFGQKQKCREILASEDGKSISFVWDNLMSEHAGIINATFSTTAVLDKGVLTFNGTIDNNSPYTIESIT